VTLRIGIAAEDAVLDQTTEPIGQDVAGDTEVGLEFLEMPEAVEGAAQDQERPALPHNLKRGADAAFGEHLPQLLRSAHGATLASFMAVT
jgi:hypothetical protein